MGKTGYQRAAAANAKLEPQDGYKVKNYRGSEKYDQEIKTRKTQKSRTLKALKKETNISSTVNASAPRFTTYSTEYLVILLI